MLIARSAIDPGNPVPSQAPSIPGWHARPGRASRKPDRHAGNNGLQVTERAGWPAVFLLLVALAPSGRAEDPIRVVVRGGAADLDGPTPILAEFPRPIPPGDYRLIAKSPSKKSYPTNAFRRGDATVLGVILGPTKAKEAETFDLVPEPSPKPSETSIHFNPEAGGVAISGGPGGISPFTKYRTDLGPKPILFPVVGPEGIAMTRSFPMEDVPGEDRDHVHHRSFWFTYGNVNGVDFWAELPGHGSIRETSRPVAVGGLAVGVLETTDDWIGPDGKKVCEDGRIARFWDLGKTRLIDFEITLKATAGPLVFGDTKEGAFGLRVASSMDAKRKPGGRIVNAEGLVDGDAWGKPSSWVDYVGPAGDKVVGIAILNHPASFRYPTPWHVRDYGLFAANPFGAKEFGIKDRPEATLPAGGSLTIRYRVIFHPGETAAADVPQAFRAYSDPPKLELP